MREYGVGIVGFGFMGKTHTYAYKSIPFFYENLPFRTKLIGVCTRREETALRAKEDYGFDVATTNLDELLEREDVHIINVCTPTANHRETVVKALKAGKHVYCDKPLTAKGHEAAEILRELEANPKLGSLTAQVAFQCRFFPATMRARQLIEEGRIGKPFSFRACYLHASSIDPKKPFAWRYDAEQGGGVLLDMGSHILDMVYYLLGEYKSIAAKNHILYSHRPDGAGNMREVKVEDYSMMMAVMKNGAVGTIEASKIATGINDELRVEIHGEKGALRFNLMDPNWLEYYDNTVSDRPLGGTKGFTKIECVQRFEKPGGGFPPPKMAVGWLRSHIHSLYNFLSCVDKGQQASPSVKDGAYIQYVMDKVYESDRLGTWLEL